MPRKQRIKKVAGALLIMAVPLTSLSPALAQTTDAGALSRELTKELPSFSPQKEEVLITPKQKPAEAPSKKKKKTSSEEEMDTLYWRFDKETPLEKILTAPVTTLYIKTDVAYDEIYDYVQKNFVELRSLNYDDLKNIRRKIWNIFLTKGRLANVSFKLAAGTKENPETALIINVDEVTVRHLTIDVSGEEKPSPEEEAHIKDLFKNLFAEGEILNLKEYDAKMKTRMRVGDYNLRISLLPASASQVDVTLAVQEKPTTPDAYLAQYDNAGIRSFGKDRLIFSSSNASLLMRTDRLDLIALKTLDIGRGSGHGVAYIRGEYSLPVSAWATRVSLWSSVLHYEAVPGTTSNSDAFGQAYEVGTSLTKPFWSGENTYLDAKTSLTGKWSRDMYDKDTETSDKNIQTLRLQLLGGYTNPGLEMANFSAEFSYGRVDLSENASALTQDKTTAKTDGNYAKLSLKGSWQQLLGSENKYDFLLSGAAQYAFHNLDSVEKMTLGGSTGMRAFGGGEASGDHGFITSFELGYHPIPWLRTFAFYDIGGIQRYADTWTDESTPNNYVLQDLGLGLSGAYQGVSFGLTYAQQIGHNPGRTDGKDSDNVERHYRVLATLGYRF